MATAMSDAGPTREARRIQTAGLDTPVAAETTRGQVLALAAVWGALTLLLLLFRPGYGFPPFRVLDGWIYTSYQWDLLHQIKEFGPTYYGSRLSWILPGALIHSVLPPVPAQIVFKVLVSGAFAAGCALVVWRAAGFRAALVAVAASVLCPPFISALHSDYIDTAVIVYGTLTLACITSARDSRRWPLLIFLGGCFYAGMIIANLSALASLGAGIAVYHLVWLRWSFWRHAASVGIYGAAAVTVCCLIGLVHRAAGGEFNFLQPQLDMLTYMRNLKVNPWMPTSRWWFMEATWLVLPVGILLWGGFVSLFSPPADQRSRDLVRALTAGLAVSFALALFLQVRELNSTLYFPFYASFHLSLALPLAAACLTAGIWPAPSGPRLAFFLATLVALIFFWDPTYVSAHLLPWLPFVHRPSVVPMACTGLLLVAAAILVLLRSRFLPRLQPWLRSEWLLLGLFAFSAGFDFHGPTLSDHLRERYVAVNLAYRALAEAYPRGSYFFWVHPDNDNGISLASTKLWGGRLFSEKNFPDYDPDTLLLPKDQTIVIPAPTGRGREVLAQVEKQLTSPHLIVRAQRIIPIPGGPEAGIDLVCFSTTPIPVDPENPADGPLGKLLVELRADGNPPYPHTLNTILYGVQKGDAIVYAAGYPVFTRTSPDDHLAMNFIELAPARAGRVRQMSFIATMPADGHCYCMVQTKDALTLAEFQITSAGRHLYNFSVPPNVTNLRFYLKSTQESPTPLPTRIAIYENTPGLPR
jgi:hypothetical protein